MWALRGKRLLHNPPGSRIEVKKPNVIRLCFFLLRLSLSVRMALLSLEALLKRSNALSFAVFTLSTRRFPFLDPFWGFHLSTLTCFDVKGLVAPKSKAALPPLRHFFICFYLFLESWSYDPFPLPFAHLSFQKAFLSRGCDSASGMALVIF